MTDSPGSSPLAGASKRHGETIALYVASVGAALAVSGALVALVGKSWRSVADALMQGAFLAPGRWGETLETAVPLLLVALGMVLGVKAGLFNIGQEGQLLMGALAMSFVGAKLAGPGPLLLVGGLIAGMVAGGLYAGIAAHMRFKRGVPEVISTLLLVFVAFQVNGLAVTTSWLLQDPDPSRPSEAVASAPLPEGVRLPAVTVFGAELSIGVVIALVLAAVVFFVLGRTVWGFRIRLLGASPRAAHRFAPAAGRAGAEALVLSGAFAGLAGAVMLSSGASGARLTTGFSAAFGWQGLLVALIAAGNPLASVPVAVLFAALRTGSGFLAATGVDRRIVDVVQALLVLALLIPPAVKLVRERRRALAAAAEGASRE